MLVERIESERLAHFSYLVGDGMEAVVIDPRRDCEVYLAKATKSGLRITHILETHRNEDYVVGSCELATRTGAQTWHADAHLPYKYGKPVRDGQVWKIGRLTVEAIASPGHTPGSMSYLARTPSGEPWMVFTGDALFAGDVGRVDLLGMDKAEEMAGLLHETIFKKILPLGDGVVVCPAHGAGSVCAHSIADRVWTTVGLERSLNPKLKFTDRDQFVASVARRLERPPYFVEMERLNVEGAPVLGRLPFPRLLTPQEFEERAGDAHVVDTRMELGFGGAHVPGSVSIWLDGLPAFAGWFLKYDRPLLLVNETDLAEKAVRFLIRLGFDRLEGCLLGGMLAWHTAGLASASVPMLTVQALCGLIDGGAAPLVLDVRGREEIESAGSIHQALNIPLTELPERMAEVPAVGEISIFCGSGLRSMTAASLLRRAGRGDLKVVLGGLAGWNSKRCPVRRSEAKNRGVKDQWTSMT